VQGVALGGEVSTLDQVTLTVTPSIAP
jgi:hypothetical protein